MVSWPSSCAEVSVSEPIGYYGLASWRKIAVESATIACEYVGPNLTYARFTDTTARNDALHLAGLGLAEPLCLTKREVIIDGLATLSAFNKLCAQWPGRLAYAGCTEHAMTVSGSLYETGAFARFCSHWQGPLTPRAHPTCPAVPKSWQKLPGTAAQALEAARIPPWCQ